MSSPGNAAKSESSSTTNGSTTDTSKPLPQTTTTSSSASSIKVCRSLLYYNTSTRLTEIESFTVIKLFNG